MKKINKSVPVRITSAAEMKELDAIAANEYGIEANLLMENAGRAAVQVLFDHYPTAGSESEILIFAGKGNNAGDSFVVARRLICLERNVRIFHLVDESEYHGATKANFEILKKMKARLINLEDSGVLENFFSTSNGPFIAIDGMLGTGLRGSVSGIYHDVIGMINKNDNVKTTVALDIPSGVSGDTGSIHNISIDSDLTISFGFPKLGHFLAPGAAHRGRLVNVDISLPPEFRRKGDKFLLIKKPMSDLLMRRDKYGHKNSFGHTLAIGGRPGRLGAVCMAARASLKMGSGLVTVATWEEGFNTLIMKIPDEVMAVPIKVDGSVDYSHYMSEFSSIVVGPGLGRRPDSKKVLEEVLSKYSGPVVLDADALNVVSKYQMHSIIADRRAPTILTPHPGEMARLLNISKQDVLADPIGSLKKAVDLTFSVVLLKGAATLMSSPDHKIYLNHYPNDGMATAGSGDVLAGMIAGLVGQNMNPFEATQLGVFLHSLSGAFAAEQYSHRAMTATSIIDNISNAIKEIKTPQESQFPEEAKAILF